MITAPPHAEINYHDPATGKGRLLKIIPGEIRWGVTADHPDVPQYWLAAYDVGANANREFAMLGILRWGFPGPSEGGA
jgi:hypothetical protein